MAYSVKFRRGTTIEHATFTGGEGEVTVDTTTNSLVVHDGVTVGGHAVASGGGAGGSVAIYASITARDAVSSNEGDLAFLSDSDTLHVYNGSEWNRVWAGPDALPTWTTELPELVTLNKDGTATTLTVAATDSEGFDIEYTYDIGPSNQSQATIANNNDGTFTLTPSTSTSDAGEFTFRAKATDGLHVISTTATAKLAFGDDITFDSTEPGITTNSTNSVDWAMVSGGTDTSGQPVSSELASGRKYFEVENISSGGAWFAGLVRSDAGQGQVGWTDNNIIQFYYSVSVVTNNTWINGTGLNQVSAGDIMQFAYDTTTGEVWIGQNGSTWWPNDPASGAGSVVGGTQGTTFRLTFGSGGGGMTSFAGNIITSAVTFNYSVPTGFTGH